MLVQPAHGKGIRERIVGSIIRHAVDTVVPRPEGRFREVVLVASDSGSLPVSCGAEPAIRISASVGTGIQDGQQWQSGLDVWHDRRARPQLAAAKLGFQGSMGEAAELLTILPDLRAESKPVLGKSRVHISNDGAAPR